MNDITQRQKQILEIIRKRTATTINDLHTQFPKSEATLRRDIKALEEAGYIRTEHGGNVYYIEQEPETLMGSVEIRGEINQDAKQRIAEKAASLIHDGDSVFIGSGSTVFYVAKQLKHDESKRLKVTTNAVPVTVALRNMKNTNVIVLGGILRPDEMSLVGNVTINALDELNTEDDIQINKVVVGIFGIDINSGLTSTYDIENLVDRRIFAMGKRGNAEIIVVADSSKLGYTAMEFIALVEDMTTLITDTDADPDIVQKIREAGVEVIQV